SCRPAAAASPARSTALAVSRSQSRSAPPTPPAADASPAILATAAGAASSKATVAPALGRRRGAKETKTQKPTHQNQAARRMAGRLHSQNSVAVESARRQHHHHLAALELGVLLDLGDLGDVGLHLVEQLGADLLVRHFTATVAQSDLHLVAFLEE